MKTVGICVTTVEAGLVCHREIACEAGRRGVAVPEIVTHTPLLSVLGPALAEGDFTDVLCESLARLAIAGADFALVPSDAVHLAFPAVDAVSPIPLLSATEATAVHCRARGHRRVGVLGTTPIVAERLYDYALIAAGIEPSYPGDAVTAEVDRLVRDEPRAAPGRVRRLIETWRPEVDAVVLASTGLCLCMDGEDSPIPLADSTRLLAHAALDAAHGVPVGLDR